jgi:hypothetical protein
VLIPQIPFEESFDGDLGSMDGEGSAGATVQAESGAPIPPAREVRAAHEVLVYKPVVGDVRPNTLYEVTGMSRALNLQVTKYNSAKRKIAEISDTESAEIVVLKRKRDRVLHTRGSASDQVLHVQFQTGKLPRF